ncbi:hypothetical protein Tco_1538354 [Tanacetum coccineum]
MRNLFFNTLEDISILLMINNTSTLSSTRVYNLEAITMRCCIVFTVKAVIHRAVITYARLQLQSQDVQINPVQTVDDSLIVSKSSWIKSENNYALSKSVNETQLQQLESLVTKSTTLEANLKTGIKALDAGSVITESSGTKSDNAGFYNSHKHELEREIDGWRE